MKKLIVVFLLLILITGCGDNYPEVLNVLNWSSYIPNEVIENFQKEYRIKVNYSTYSSNEELLAKVSNVKKGTYDISFPSDYMVEIMKNKNLLEELDKTRLKNYNNLNDKFLNQYYDENNKYSLPFISASTVISQNKQCINDTITSYNDLLNKNYKNQIVLVDDQRIIIGMALLATGHDSNTTDSVALDAAYEWLKQLKPNIKAYDSDSPKNFLITEEACLGVIWNAEGALASFENPNIVNIFPTEGTSISIDNFTILKGSENLDNAYKFIDYILRPDVMKLIIESYPYQSVNNKTESLLDVKYTSNPAINIPDYVIDNSHFVMNVGKDIKKYDNVWIKIK